MLLAPLSSASPAPSPSSAASSAAVFALLDDHRDDGRWSSGFNVDELEPCRSLLLMLLSLWLLLLFSFDASALNLSLK